LCVWISGTLINICARVRFSRPVHVFQGEILLQRHNYMNIKMSNITGHCIFTLIYLLGKTVQTTFYSLGVLFKRLCCERGTRWSSWLRCRVTSRKIEGSIPDGVTGIFHWRNSSGHTMALGLAESPKEMSTRNISLEPSGSVQVYNGIAFFTRLRNIYFCLVSLSECAVTWPVCRFVVVPSNRQTLYITHSV
jgi:hypothetical protein